MKRYPTLFNILCTLAYASMILWIYEIQILRWWSYSGFDGGVSSFKAITCLLISAVLAMLLPTGTTSRAILLTILHYAFFVPSVVILTTNRVVLEYPISIMVAYVILKIFSTFKINAVVVAELRPRQMLFLLSGMVSLAILIQIAFGGLSHFNLNLERVYEFRRVAAAELPTIFGYLYSNVTNVLIPTSLVMAVIYRSNFLIACIVLASVVLFGMTHHKSVFFTPFIVLILFFIFNRVDSAAQLGWIFVSLPAIALIEIFFIDQVAQIDIPGFFSSYAIRRSLLVPPMLDKIFVEFFTENPKYYWSSSRFSFGLIQSPSDVSASFLIGREFFGDNDMSANTGMVGSGFSNSGVLGVALYAAITGILISILDGQGRRLGHSFVASIAVMLISYISTSTDLTTALLTHGLFMLLIVLSIAPKSISMVMAHKRVNK